MEFCHQHNLVNPQSVGAERPFGIKVSLPPGDTFERLLGSDWERLHWYATESERDLAFRQMAERHGYYRTTDTATHKGPLLPAGLLLALKPVAFRPYQLP